MFSHLKFYFKNFDWIIFSTILLLISFSLIEIYSIALGQDNLNFIFFKKQLLFSIIGFILLFVFSIVDYHFLRSLNNYFYGGAILLLLAVLLLGKTIRGTTGWFDIAGFGIQPVEIVKIVLILFLANYFSNLATKVKTLKHFFVSAIYSLILIVLVLLQPDFGSALILGVIWFIMMIAAGFKKKYIISIILIILVLFSLAWTVFFKDYQRERIITLFNPQASSLESGYNSSQAIIAIGSGGLIGKGVGFGSQSQLKFLPEAQNDFIFSVISEELGFLGIVLVLTFYMVFFLRSLIVLRKINNDYGIYFIIGVIGLIFIQMFINIGMNLGILPIVGLTLPFMSYGGSSLISLLILVGLMENIIIKSKIRY